MLAARSSSRVIVRLSAHLHNIGAVGGGCLKMVAPEDGGELRGPVGESEGREQKESLRYERNKKV